MGRGRGGGGGEALTTDDRLHVGRRRAERVVRQRLDGVATAPELRVRPVPPSLLQPLGVEGRRRLAGQQPGAARGADACSAARGRRGRGERRYPHRRCRGACLPPPLSARTAPHSWPSRAGPLVRKSALRKMRLSSWLILWAPTMRVAGALSAALPAQAWPPRLARPSWCSSEARRPDQPTPPPPLRAPPPSRTTFAKSPDCAATCCSRRGRALSLRALASQLPCRSGGVATNCCRETVPSWPGTKREFPCSFD